MGEPVSRTIPMVNNGNTHNIGVEPFLIFCYERRQATSQQNPFLNSSGITSLLGSIWRSMNDEEKQIYVEMAMQIKTLDKIPHTFSLQNRKISSKYQSSILQQSHKTEEKNVPLTQNSPPMYIPKITIMSRNGFGIDAEEISNKIRK